MNNLWFKCAIAFFMLASNQSWASDSDRTIYPSGYGNPQTKLSTHLAPAIIYYAVDTNEPFMKITVDYEVFELQKTCMTSQSNWVTLINSHFNQQISENSYKFSICKNGKHSIQQLDNKTYAELINLKKTVKSDVLVHNSKNLSIIDQYSDRISQFFYADPRVLKILLEYVRDNIFLPTEYTYFIQMKSHGTKDFSAAVFHEVVELHQTQQQFKQIEKYKPLVVDLSTYEVGKGALTDYFDLIFKTNKRIHISHLGSSDGSLGTVDLGTVDLGTVDLGTVDLGTVDLGTVDLGNITQSKKSKVLTLLSSYVTGTTEREMNNLLWWFVDESNDKYDLDSKGIESPIAYFFQESCKSNQLSERYPKDYYTSDNFSDDVASHYRALGTMGYHNINWKLLLDTTNFDTATLFEAANEHFANIQNRFPQDELLDALKSGDLELTIDLIESGVSPFFPAKRRFSKNKNGNNALHIAAVYIQTDIVEYLINKFPEIANTPGENDDIPFEAMLSYKNLNNSTVNYYKENESDFNKTLQIIIPDATFDLSKPVRWVNHLQFIGLDNSAQILFERMVYPENLLNQSEETYFKLLALAFEFNDIHRIEMLETYTRPLNNSRHICTELFPNAILSGSSETLIKIVLEYNATKCITDDNQYYYNKLYYGLLGLNGFSIEMPDRNMWDIDPSKKITEGHFITAKKALALGVFNAFQYDQLRGQLELTAQTEIKNYPIRFKIFNMVKEWNEQNKQRKFVLPTKEKQNEQPNIDLTYFYNLLQYSDFDQIFKEYDKIFDQYPDHALDLTIITVGIASMGHQHELLEYVLKKYNPFKDPLYRERFKKLKSETKAQESEQQGLDGGLERSISMGNHPLLNSVRTKSLDSIRILFKYDAHLTYEFTGDESLIFSDFYDYRGFLLESEEYKWAQTVKDLEETKRSNPTYISKDYYAEFTSYSFGFVDKLLARADAVVDPDFLFYISKYPKLTKLFIKHKSKFNNYDLLEMTPDALQVDNLVFLKYFLDTGHSVFETLPMKDTNEKFLTYYKYPLKVWQLAMDRGASSIVSYILNNHLIDPVALDSNGSNILHFAGFLEPNLFAQLPFDQLDFNLMNSFGETPLSNLVCGYRAKPQRILDYIEFGADPRKYSTFKYKVKKRNRKTKEHYYIEKMGKYLPIHCTMKYDIANSDYRKYLTVERIKHKTDYSPRYKDYDYDYNVQRDYDSLKVLLDVAPDTLNSKDHKGRTPLHLAQRTFTEFSELILSYKPNVNAQDIKGETPLHYALDGRPPLEHIELLLTHGADKSIASFDRGSYGDETPFDRTENYDPSDITVYETEQTNAPEKLKKIRKLLYIERAKPNFE